MDIKLKKFIRNDDEVEYDYDEDGILARDGVNKKSHEAPIQDLDTLIYNTRNIAAKVMDLSEAWFGPETVTMRGVSFSKNMACQIHFDKKYPLTDTMRREKTPAFYFRDQEDEHSKVPERQISPAMAEAIEELIVLARKYIGGERQQLLLPLKDPEATTEEESGVEEEMEL